MIAKSRCRIRPELLAAAVAVVLMIAEAGLAEDESASVAVPVQGERFAGRLAGISADGQVTFSTDGDDRQLDLRHLVYWGRYVDQPEGSQLVLADGSVLSATVLKLAADSLVIDSRLWGEVAVPPALCHAVSFARSADPLERDRQSNRLQTASATAARLFLRNGDEISGQLPAGNANDEQAAFGIVAINFIPEGGTATAFEVRQVQSLAFAAREPSRAPIACWLGLRDGSLLAVSTVRSDGDAVEIQLACGLQLRAAAERLWRQAASLESRQAEVTYLSDLPHADYRHFPFLTVRWPLGIDENVLGGRLRSGGQVVSKGLGMHSTSRLVYDLNRGYSKLDAELALDDQAGPRGSVVYRVFVERPEATTRKWSLAYTSPVVRGSDAVLPISIDVAGATRMALAVEAADQGDTLDHANWLRARLVPAAEAMQE